MCISPRWLIRATFEKYAPNAHRRGRRAYDASFTFEATLDPRPSAAMTMGARRTSSCRRPASRTPTTRSPSITGSLTATPVSTHAPAATAASSNI
jgi:hypothetical protein